MSPSRGAAVSMRAVSVRPNWWATSRLMSLAACSVSGACQLRGDILADDCEAGGGQVQLVVVEEELLRRIGDAAGVGQRRAGKADQPIGVEIVRDLVEQQRPVQIMDDHAVRGIAGQGGLHRFVEGGRIRRCGSPAAGRVAGDFRKQRSVAGKEADVLRAGIDQRVEPRGREGRRSRRRGRCAGRPFRRSADRSGRRCRRSTR